MWDFSNKLRISPVFHVFHVWGYIKGLEYAAKDVSIFYRFRCLADFQSMNLSALCGQVTGIPSRNQIRNVCFLLKQKGKASNTQWHPIVCYLTFPHLKMPPKRLCFEAWVGGPFEYLKTVWNVWDRRTRTTSPTSWLRFCLNIHRIRQLRMSTRGIKMNQFANSKTTRSLRHVFVVFATYSPRIRRIRTQLVSELVVTYSVSPLLRCSSWIFSVSDVAQAVGVNRHGALTFQSFQERLEERMDERIDIERF